MSEIADELERMARELDEAADRTSAAQTAPKHSDMGQLFGGVITGYRKSADKLRERAAELRQQRSGPTFEQQTKPAAVGSGQWWRFGGGVARLVTGFEERGGDMYACFNGNTSAAHPRDAVGEMLASADWTYLGDGPEPAR